MSNRELKEFVLYEFVEEDIEKDDASSRTKDIDISPVDWVFFDDETKQTLTVFPAPPYDDETVKLFHSLVKAKAPPPDDWPTYPIFVRGHAATYAEAQCRLRSLKKKKYAYTTGDETEGEKKSKEIEDKIRSKTVKIKSIETIMAQVPQLNAKVGKDDTSNNSNTKSQNLTANPGSSIANNFEKKTAINNNVMKKTVKKTTSEVQKPGPSESNLAPIEKSLKSEIAAIKENIDKLLKLSNKFDGLLTELVENQRMMNLRINSFTERSVSPSTDFLVDNNMQVPFENYEIFQEFDNKLSTEPQFQEDFKASLSRYFDAKLRTRRSITNILKKYFSKNLALLFVSARKKEGKYVYKQTRMYECLRDSLILTHRNPTSGLPITEDYFLSELTTIFPNAKDWDGGRSARAVPLEKAVPQN